MTPERATALVLRTTDWSETSRIATLWTREHGKIRALAKGARRLKSSFENALDLLNVCGIVFIRKSPGALDLLTEARIVRRFPGLSRELSALYGGYYVAELLSDWTEEHDPHPELFDAGLTALAALGEEPEGTHGWHLMRFEMRLLHELGYAPVLDRCSHCGGDLGLKSPLFGTAIGGLVCPSCEGQVRDGRRISPEGLTRLRGLAESGDATPPETEAKTEAELRRLLSHYVTYLMGRRPRMLSYLEQGS